MQRKKQALTHKDVAWLEVAMQHGGFASVQVQHAPRNAAHHVDQLGRLPLRGCTVMQHDVQGSTGAVLHDQIQVIIVLTEPSQGYNIVV